MIRDYVTKDERFSFILPLELTEKEKERRRKKLKRRIKSDAVVMMISGLCFVGYLIIYFMNFWR